MTYGQLIDLYGEEEAKRCFKLDFPSYAERFDVNNKWLREMFVGSVIPMENCTREYQNDRNG